MKQLAIVCCIACIIFITLKVVGATEYSWWWLALPLGTAYACKFIAWRRREKVKAGAMAFLVNMEKHKKRG